MTQLRIHTKEEGTRLTSIITTTAIKLEHEALSLGWMPGIYLKEPRNHIKEGKGGKGKNS